MAFRATVTLSAALDVLAGAPSLGMAQVLASQFGKVAQTVDRTTITIEYYRPVARDR